MSASGEVTLKTTFGGSKPSSKFVDLENKMVPQSRLL